MTSAIIKKYLSQIAKENLTVRQLEDILINDGHVSQVKIRFGIITQKAIHRGTFKSVKQLVSKIERFVQNYNANMKPFMWTATADSILEKIEGNNICMRTTVRLGTEQIQLVAVHPFQGIVIDLRNCL